MTRPIKIRIDVTKIDKARLFKGSKGTYLNLVAFESKGSDYGDTHFIKQDKDKDDDSDLPIIGNLTVPGSEPAAKPEPAKVEEEEEDEIPF